MPFREVDVSVDRAAAEEMVARTHQMGVPVIADEQEAIVGFDQPRLARMAERHRKAPGLGLRVANAKDGPGALVGSVRPGSPAERAGVLPGDVVVEMSGKPVQSADDLEALARQRPKDRPTSMTVLRQGERKTLILPA